jgi:hypothetical protein
VDTSDRHGFAFYGRRGGPKLDLRRVTVLEIASPNPLPGGTSLCDGTWILRFRTYPKKVERDLAQRERVAAISDELGLPFVEREVSATLAETWRLHDYRNER